MNIFIEHWRRVDRIEGSDIEFTVAEERPDELVCPLPDTAYHVVFEVLKDGSIHPHAWSRLPDIGTFVNSKQARSLAIRIEWEHPVGTGSWRFRYIQSDSVTQSFSKDVVGANQNYWGIISHLRWLFDAKPNNVQPWMLLNPGSAYVLQAHYDYHLRRLAISRCSMDDFKGRMLSKQTCMRLGSRT